MVPRSISLRNTALRNRVELRTVDREWPNTWNVCFSSLYRVHPTHGMSSAPYDITRASSESARYASSPRYTQTSVSEDPSRVTLEDTALQGHIQASLGQLSQSISPLLRILILGAKAMSSSSGNVGNVGQMALEGRSFMP